MAKLTTNWTNRDRTRFTNCKYTVLPQIGIKKQIRDVSERGRAGPLQGLPSSPFLPGHISHSVGDDHTKADAASVASTALCVYPH